MIIYQMELPFEGRGEAPRTGRSEEPSSADRGAERPGASGLLAEVLGRRNLHAALRRVKQNKGSAGIDGMRVEELPEYLGVHWERLREELISGTYRPQPVKRQEIAKAGGGTRQLGIPTVLDRFIQQALLQILQPRIDPSLSEHSHGFRPGRRAHDAVREAQRYIRDGCRWVVDVDLESFFDRVHHDVLMERLSRRISDKPVLKLIRLYLEAGILVNGVKVDRHEGTPQGGPLSPLLANVLLDEVDKELERRGHRFVRYADDCAPRRRERRADDLAILKQPCCTRDEGRPLGAGLQEQAPNHLELRGSRARVVSVVGKGGARLRQVRIEETSASEPPMTCRKRRDGVRTGGSRYSGMSLGCTCLLPIRRPALRRRDLGSGSRAERGNLSLRCEGRIPSGGPMRKRVPKRGTGAELRIVVVKVL